MNKKNHVVSNTLSKLIFENKQIDKNSKNKFDLNTYYNEIIDFSNNFDCYVFQNIFIVMSKNLKKKIKNEYQNEKT